MVCVLPGVALPVFAWDLDCQGDWVWPGVWGVFVSPLDCVQGPVVASARQELNFIL